MNSPALSHSSSHVSLGQLSTSQVINALNSTYQAKSSQNKETTQWLEDFQKTNDAWTIADSILKDVNLPDSHRMFAAQTLRQKILFDLPQLQMTARFALRDNLLQIMASLGQKPMILRYVAIGLADLAVQLKTWNDPVGDVIQTFSNQVPVVLSFLTCLPEEFSNEKIPIEYKDRQDRGDAVLQPHALQVLSTLQQLFTSAPGESLKTDVLICLKSWVFSGDISIRDLLNTPFLDVAFQLATSDDDASELAVDLICEIIHRSGALEKNMAVVHNIYPRLAPMHSYFQKVREEEDEEKVRGLSRIFVEAAEAYLPLLLDNFEAFKHLLQGVLDCTGYPDTDIAKISFNFWFELTEELLKDPSRVIPFYPTYESLVHIMLQHLQYPDDLNSMTAQQREEFREFRHDMGDVLKDCVKVLGVERALMIPCNKLATFVGGNAKWQQIEAPLFSLRTMGSQVPNDESVILPELMRLLPNLPNHPKIRYATLLVIGRYASWTAKHAEFIPYQLTFVSSGIEVTDPDQQSAAAQAFLYLCESCKDLLVSYLDQLHPFYLQTLPRLSPEDRVRMVEAVCNVITAVPVEDMPRRFTQFFTPIAQDLGQTTTNPPPPTPNLDEGEVDESQEAWLKHLSQLIQQLATFYRYGNPANVKQQLGSTPHPLAKLLQDLWPNLDYLLQKYGEHRLVARSISRLLVYAVDNLGTDLLSMLPAILNRIVPLYQTTQAPHYIWLCRKCFDAFNRNPEVGASMFGLFEALSHATFSMVEKEPVDNIPDVVEEYFATVMSLAKSGKLENISPSLFNAIVQCGSHCLITDHPEASVTVLESLGELIEQASKTSLASQFPPLGPGIITSIFQGIFYTHPPDVVRDDADLLVTMKLVYPDTLNWVKTVIDQVPLETLTVEEKNDWMSKFVGANKNNKPFRYATEDLSRMYRRRSLVKDRRSK